MWSRSEKRAYEGYVKKFFNAMSEKSGLPREYRVAAENFQYFKMIQDFLGQKAHIAFVISLYEGNKLIGQEGIAIHDPESEEFSFKEGPEASFKQSLSEPGNESAYNDEIGFFSSCFQKLTDEIIAP